MKTRILTITILLVAGMLFSQTAFASKKATRFASSLENISDPLMNIESWMISDLLWQPTELLEMVTVKEESLCLESWMTQPEYWDLHEIIMDTPLTLQAWMTSSLFWENCKSIAENHLELESWMTNDFCWYKRAAVAEVEAEVLELECG